MAFLTARSPSLIASLICVMVCWLGPFTSSVTERGFPHFSMNVYFSSPCKQGPEKSPNVEARNVTLKGTNDSFNVCDTDHRCTTRTAKQKLTSVCSYTKPALPRYSGLRSSTEFMGMPPQASVSLKRGHELNLLDFKNGDLAQTGH